jgi:hypothetical protein
LWLHSAFWRGSANESSGSGALGAIEGLREKGFKGKITVLSKEAYLPIDRVGTSLQ